MCINWFKKKVVYHDSKIDEEYQRQVLMKMRVKVDNKTYLKADDLIKYIGLDSLSGVLSRDSSSKEVRSILIAYKLKENTGNINIAPTPLYTKTSVDFSNPQIHYAFDSNILPFIKKVLENEPTEQYLYGQVKKIFDTL